MSQKIVTKTAISLLLLFLLLPSISSLPLILSEFLPSPQPSTTETTSPPSSEPSDPSSKFSSSVSAIGNLLSNKVYRDCIIIIIIIMSNLVSNKAKFLGDQSSLLGHQMEMLEKVILSERNGSHFLPSPKRFFCGINFQYCTCVNLF